jgi:acyl-CoA synthetase (AMP-forming)/AMP-acid ligase II
MFVGYWRRPDATREAFTGDGWYRTGDVAELRADGNVRLVGRLREMFKSGGYNVYPAEVEGAIEAFDGVAMAAVVPVADALYQEVGVAFVVPAPGARLDVEALRDHCRERLANYKVPKRFSIEPELPMLPIGKIDRGRLRALAATRAAAEASPIPHPR